MKFKNIISAALASALVLMLSGCDKPFEYSRPLAVNSRAVTLSADAGSTHVMVYSDGDWTASLTEPVKWASLNKLSGQGISDIVFTYSANYAVSRQVGIVFQSGEAIDTVMMTQKGIIEDASFLFDNSSLTLLRSGSTVSAPVSTNLRYGLESIKSSVTYLEELYADEDSSDDYEKWISDIEITRKAVNFHVLENTTGEPRIAYINFEVYDPKKEGQPVTAVLVITQTASDPEFTLKETETKIDGYAGTYSVESVSNNISAYADQVVAECDADWISDITVTKTGLSFDATENDGDVARTGSIKISFSDALNHSVTASLSVTQAVAPREITFSEVRALTPGTITKVNYIEGYIVSDYTSPNIVSSTQTGQFMFDRSANAKTAYFESMDGQYGFKLVFATAADAAIARYTRLRINVAGLKLVKEGSSPDRFAIEGVTADNILESEAGDKTKVPTKNKSIADLTDSDIYTLVSLQNMEIMCKDGAYTNCTDGYSFKDDINPASGSSTAPRWDEAPLLMTDPNGDAIYMITNANCPWRRGGSGDASASVKATWDLAWNKLVPQGSGTFNAIVVAGTQATVRYGDLGRYQLRYMGTEDFSFSNSAFSKTIVEWNWNNRVAGDVVPEVGDGQLLTYSAALAAAADFNNPYNGRASDGGNGGATSNQKGLVSNGGLKMTNSWWDFTTNEGRYFDVKFSTAGISGTNLVFGIVWNHGSMNNTTLDSPSHWKLLYSVDGGTTFKDAGCDIIKNRSIVWWTTTSQDSCPGFKDNLRKLPNECFGKESVIVRVQAADTVCDTNPAPSAVTDDSYLQFLGIEQGTLTNKSTEVRIGTITVRYN